MLAGKLDFGVMGDYPLIVNGAKFQETGKQETRFIAVTGYNLRGTGNGIVVPIDSDAQSLADLWHVAFGNPGTAEGKRPRLDLCSTDLFHAKPVVAGRQHLEGRGVLR